MTAFATRAPLHDDSSAGGSALEREEDRKARVEKANKASATTFYIVLFSIIGGAILLFSIPLIAPHVRRMLQTGIGAKIRKTEK